MPKILSALILLGLCVTARAGSYYDLRQSASSATLKLGGNLSLGATTTGTQSINLDGVTGGISGNNITAKGKPWYDITAFGAVADGTGNAVGPGTDNSTAIRAAIAAATNTINNVGNSNGAVVYIPVGVYYIGVSTIVVPAGIRIEGANTQTTILYSSGTGYAFQLGNTAGTLSGGTGVSDLTLDLLTSKSNGILLYGAVYAKIDNVVIAGGAVYNPSSIVCVGIDGANISAFGNSINNVTCLHAHTGVLCKTTGNTDSTAQYISNFYFDGDDGSFPGNGSVGIDIGAGLASDCESTQIYGGDLEQTTTGIILRAGGSGPIEVFGTRFEQNVGHGQANIVLAADSNPSTFVGLVGIVSSTSGIDDLATISSHTYIGNVDQSAFPRPSLIQSLTVNASMTPMNVLLDATHQWQYINSAQGFGNEFLVTEGFSGNVPFIQSQQVSNGFIDLGFQISGGSVSIGGISPLAVLDVNGTANIRQSLKVSGQTNFPGVAISSSQITQQNVTQTSALSSLKLSTLTWSSNGNIAHVHYFGPAYGSGGAASLYLRVYLDGAPGTGTAIGITQEFDFISALASSNEPVVLDFTFRTTAGVHTLALNAHVDNTQTVNFCPNGSCEFRVEEF